MPSPRRAVILLVMTNPDGPYENRARAELEAWREQMVRGPSLFDRAAGGLQGRINRIIPERVHLAVTAVIERMTRAILTGSDFTTAKPLAAGDLSEREALVRKRIDAYRATAAAEGGVAGAGGFMLAAAEFPVLIATKIKLLFDIAALYGHDGKAWEERLFILSIFQLAFSSPDHRREIYEAMFAPADPMSGQPAGPDDIDWRKFQQQYRDYIDLAKLAQLIPVIGAPVGAIVNYRMLDRLGATAMNAYRARWFAEDGSGG